jgi:hypothetical protein
VWVLVVTPRQEEVSGRGRGWGWEGHGAWIERILWRGAMHVKVSVVNIVYLAGVRDTRERGGVSGITVHRVLSIAHKVSILTTTTVIHIEGLGTGT